MVLVGLVDGGLALAEVLKAGAHLTPEIQVTELGRCIKGMYVPRSVSLTDVTWCLCKQEQCVV